MKSTRMKTLTTKIIKRADLNVMQVQMLMVDKRMMLVKTMINTKVIKMSKLKRTDFISAKCKDQLI